MPEARERKNSDKIKGKDSGGNSLVKKDIHRQMTVKLQKEFAEQKRNRDTGGNSGTTPEVQAAEQVEKKIYTTADSIREHTGNAVSKSISRHRRKQQKKKHQRTEQATGEATQTDTEAAPSPAQERIRERAADDIKTRPADNCYAAPIRDREPDIVRERPAASRPGPERTPAGLSPKERMRQTVIKEKQDQRTDIRQRPADIGGQRQTDSPVREPPPAQPKPQERMRQKATAELQTRRTAAGRVSSPARPDRTPAPTHNTGITPATTHSTGITPATPNNQSINPIKERRSFAPKEKPVGGSFVPKTRQTAAASKSAAKTASTAAKGKKAARPLELAKRRVQRNAQRKLLQQSASKSKAALDLSRRAAVATAKAVSSLISAIAGLLGGAILIPIICVVALIAAIAASPFGILFSNEPTPEAMPLNIVIEQLNMELSDKLETLQTGDYSSIDIQGLAPDWREVVAVFAAKTAGADDGVDVAALTPDRVDILRAVFWDMCVITSEVETIDHPDSNPDDDTDDSWTENILHITITAKSADDMRTQYAFTEYQNQALTDLIAELARM